MEWVRKNCLHTSDWRNSTTVGFVGKHVQLITSPNCADLSSLWWTVIKLLNFPVSRTFPHQSGDHPSWLRSNPWPFRSYLLRSDPCQSPDVEVCFAQAGTARKSGYVHWMSERTAPENLHPSWFLNFWAPHSFINSLVQVLFKKRDHKNALRALLTHLSELI